MGWELLSLASIALAAWALTRSNGVGPQRRTPFLLALTGATWGAIWTNTYYEQASGVLLAVVALGLWLARGPRAWLGGALLGLSVHLKVMPVVLIPALIGRYLSEVVLPRAVDQNAKRLGNARVPNNSFSAVVQRLFGDSERLSFYSPERGPLVCALPADRIRWWGFGAALGLYVLALAIVARRRGAALDDAEAGLALTAANLGNPLSWPHHMSVLALVAAPLAAHASAGGRPLRLALLTLSALTYLPLVVYLPPFAGRLPLGPSEHFQAFGFPTLGILVLWGTAGVWLWRRARSTAA